MQSWWLSPVANRRAPKGVGLGTSAFHHVKSPRDFPGASSLHALACC
jgi:hypothetical protein